MSFAIGPFVLPIERMTLLLAFAAAVLVGWLMGRRWRVQVEPVLTWMLVAGLLFGRLTFVLMYLDDYLAKPWSIIDIRDGGFFPAAGLLAAVAMGAFYAWRDLALRIPLSAAVATGLLTWIIGTGAVGIMHTTRPSMPVLVLTNLQGGSETLSELHQGRPMVVNIWATWCPPCRREMPVLEEAQQREDGVTLVLINQGETREIVARYLEQEQLQLRNVMLDLQSNTTRQMGVRALPTTLFFNADGQLVDTHFGELSAATLRHSMRGIIDENALDKTGERQIKAR